MKKTSFFLLAGLCFVLPSYGMAQSVQPVQPVQTVQQTVQPNSVPVQVNVNVSNTASAQGNTVFNEQKQSVRSSVPDTDTAAAASSRAAVQNLSGKNSLYGEYYVSPYQNSLQTEMLRHTVWGSLVPRKKLYADPALGKYPPRYSVAKPKAAKQETNCPETVQNNNVSAAVPDTAAPKSAVPDAKNAAGTSSIYEPLNKQPNTPPAGGADSSVQQKVEDLQNSLLIPKV